MRTTRLRATMREVKPKVERVIDVPAAITLDELHEVMQVALGWTDSHLHHFRAEDTIYAVPIEEWGEEVHEVDERGVPLSSMPQTFVYAYDFGDGWEHDIERLGQGNDLPGCVGGEGACPPEDCGGPHGYTELLEALANDRHPHHAAMSAWAEGRSQPFDQELTARRVRDMVGVLPESAQLLLDLVTDGVKLTPGGRLPRSVVRAVQAHRPGWHPLGQPASIEEDLYPLTALHDILRHVGLLRLANGVLRPTKAARDETQAVRRLRSWFPPQEFSTMVAERAVALLEAHGPMQVPQLATDAFGLLGLGWQRGGQPITAHDVERELRRLSAQLRALDLVETSRSSWSAGPSARSLLPGATLLADLV